MFHRISRHPACRLAQILTVIFLSFGFLATIICSFQDKCLFRSDIFLDTPDILALDCPRAIRPAKLEYEETSQRVVRKEPTLKSMQEEWKTILSDESVVRRWENCEYLDELAIPVDNDYSSTDLAASSGPPYLAHPVRRKPVPLAFGILIHENLGSFETLLSLLFKPYHTFCIHVDAKAEKVVHKTVRQIVDCHKKRYPESTMFVLDPPSDIYWGHISLLKVDLRCLQTSLDANAHWKYFLNLAGSEMPTMAAEELEDTIESRLNGTSLAHGEIYPKWWNDRISFVHKLVLDKHESYIFLKKTKIRKGTPPFNLTIYKGLKNVVLNRTFSTFLLKDPVSKALLSYLEDTNVPDESFYTTLLRVRVNKDTGLVTQEQGPLPEPLFTRYTRWNGLKQPCAGVMARNVCQFSMMDLPSLVKEAENSLFVNKFNISLDSLALACWSERVKRRQS